MQRQRTQQQVLSSLRAAHSPPLHTHSRVLFARSTHVGVSTAPPLPPTNPFRLPSASTFACGLTSPPRRLCLLPPLLSPSLLCPSLLCSPPLLSSSSLLLVTPLPPQSPRYSSPPLPLASPSLPLLVPSPLLLPSLIARCKQPIIKRSRREAGRAGTPLASAHRGGGTA